MPSEPINGVPKEFLDRLRAYDPLLRLRWGQQQGYWRVERKIKRGSWYSPAQAMNQDDYECTRDGYILALRFRQNEMDERVFYTLFMSDMHRFKDFASMLEEDERKEFLAKRKAWGERNEYLARDLWTSLNTSYRHKAIGKGDFDPSGVTY